MPAAAAGVVGAYKNLAQVGRDFAIMKADDLAPYAALAPLTYTDEHPPTRDNPVAPARRSPAA